MTAAKHDAFVKFQRDTSGPHDLRELLLAAYEEIAEIQSDSVYYGHEYSDNEQKIEALRACLDSANAEIRALRDLLGAHHVSEPCAICRSVGGETAIRHSDVSV